MCQADGRPSPLQMPVEPGRQRQAGRSGGTKNEPPEQADREGWSLCSLLGHLFEGRRRHHGLLGITGKPSGPAVCFALSGFWKDFILLSFLVEVLLAHDSACGGSTAR